MSKKVYDYVFSVTKNQINPSFSQDYLSTLAIIDNICQRCGSVVNENHCPECSELGLLTKEDYLYRLPGPIPYQAYQDQLQNLNLTPLQQQASNFIIDNIKTKQNCLIWAVCGAGKTEISFEAIEYILKQNKLVCFCIPRIDILYEIAERLRQFFPNTKVSIVNGVTKEKEDTQIFVMTTNQLLKCKQVFDLVIVDEVDAFPFSYHPKFMYALNTSLTESGIYCCLTSTPSKMIEDLMLNTFIIYKRWHNYLLPEPYLRYLPTKNKFIYYWLFKKLFTKINRPQLIFVCNKQECQKLSIFLQKILANKKIDYVHSSKENRRTLIEDFANNKIDILITTPILERGVTFKDLDVYVMDSDNPLYDKASLVQIAGRCGRNPNFQEGKVYFYYQNYTDQIDSACKQIKEMNNKAKKSTIN